MFAGLEFNGSAVGGCVDFTWHPRCSFTGCNYKSMKSIISGVVLIGIGFAIGDSIFTGNFTVTSLFFDGLGLFFIGKGAFHLWRQRQAQ